MKPTISIVPTRERVTIEKRKPLSRAQAVVLTITQNGLCGCGCGVKLDPLGEKIVDEHVAPRGLGGANALWNRSLWRRPCSLAKTHGKSGDLARIAKAKRQAGETGNGSKRKIRSNPTIPARGFPTAARPSWPKRRITR